MRNLLAAAVAIAPLMTASGAMAEVVISSSRTTPIQTSNATGSGADSVRIASSGALNLSSGAAVTVDSSHNFKMDLGGSISMTSSADGSTAVRVVGGHTAAIDVSGTIVVEDNVTEVRDTNNDGIPDGPFATGADRAGIRVVGPGAHTGDISLTAGQIVVEGANSYGISVETALIGRLSTTGSVRVIGDNTAGVRTTSSVSGDVAVRGAINAQGENARAVDIGGDVGGRLSIQNNVSASGYRYTTRPLEFYVNLLDADDLLQGGPAVRIAGNVAGGVFLEIAPPNTDPDNADEDGDGIPDIQESNAFVTSYGAAPTIDIGSTQQTVTLGVVGTGDRAFGFINDGQIRAEGVYDNVDANGVAIGVAGGQAVTVQGGVRNTGAITATAVQGGSATAIRLRDGATVPTIVNTGNITASATSTDPDTAVAIRVDAAGDLRQLNNSGVIGANVTGHAGSATAVQDLSGTLDSITNTFTIAGTVARTSTSPVLGRGVALDLRANTSGVTLTQYGVPGTPTATDPDTDGDGVLDSREPVIIGDILLGAGSDVVDIRNGSVLGAIEFGAGADRLSISGGAEVRGALSSSGGQLDIDVSNGLLESRHSGQLAVNSLNVGADSTLIVALDPANAANGGFRVNGTANLASGAEFGVRFLSLLDGPARFNIIQADNLNAGALDLGDIEANSPYLFRVQAGVDQAGNAVFVDARRRTAQEIGFITSEAAIYESIYRALESNDVLRESMLNQTGRDGFINLFEQLLPEHSGGPLMSLASGVDAVTRALTGRNASAAPGQTSAWVQEINFYADKDKTDTYGFRSEGFGVAGGVERGTGLGAMGLTLAFTSTDLEDPEAEAEEVLSANLIELGLYWRAQGQNWTTWARAAGGYAWFDSTRQLVADGLNIRSESDWAGWTVALAGGASYEHHIGKLNIRPEAYVEYFSLSESAHRERGGGGGFDLDLDSRSGHLFSAVAAVNIGYGFGRDGWVRPEVRLGWRQNISSETGDTVGRFRSGGPDFHLPGMGIEGGGPILGFRLNVGNALGMLAVTGDAELLEDYVRYTLLLRASFRF